jgi:hypothetical protein
METGKFICKNSILDDIHEETYNSFADRMESKSVQISDALLYKISMELESVQISNALLGEISVVIDNQFLARILSSEIICTLFLEEDDEEEKQDGET